MMKAARELSPFAKGVYFSLNPLKAEILARRRNRVDRAKEGELAGDKDVVRRRWLLIDADPVRDPHISATTRRKPSPTLLPSPSASTFEGGTGPSRSWPTAATAITCSIRSICRPTTAVS